MVVWVSPSSMDKSVIRSTGGKDTGGCDVEIGYFRCGAGVGGVNITGGGNATGGSNVVGGGTVCDLVTL